MKQLIIILALALSFLPVVAQEIEPDNEEEIDVCQMQVDSILSLISPSTPDSTKARLYSEVAYTSDNTDTVLKYSFLSLDLCQESDRELIADNNAYIGWAYYFQDKSRKALDYYFKAIDYYKNIRPELVANKYLSIAKCYHELNIHDSVFSYFNKALDIYTKLNDSIHIAYTYQSIGIINSDLGYHSTAIEYFNKAIYLDSLLNQYLALSEDYKFVGNIEFQNNNYPKALELLRKSVSIIDTINTDDSYSIRSKYGTYLDLADAYIEYSKETNNKLYADSCLLYLQKINNYYINSSNYDAQYRKMLIHTKYLSFIGNNNEALKVLLDCKQFLEQDEDANDTRFQEFYEHLTNYYKKVGDYKNALEASDKAHEYALRNANDSTLNTIADFKTEQAMKIHNAEAKQLKAEKSRLTIIAVSLVVGLMLVSLLVFYILRMLTIKRKANEELTYKNQMLDQQKSEIETQRDEIITQKEEIATQRDAFESVNKNLVSSINYAQRIQQAALSLKTEIDAVFPENFVFYRPRDIVSGDYYRVMQCGKYHVLVTADCTGHGIPGAFLSMLGISALKEYCVTEQDASEPGTILDNMRSFIKTTLNTDSNRKIDDGMDMSVCCFDFENMELRYASALHTIYLLRNGEIIKLKGDRMPVGRYIIEKEHFTTHCLKIENGDIVYTFSDGIEDQPGGDLSNPAGKKFLSRNLSDFLLANYQKPMATQCQLLGETIDNWRNGRAQVDDMTMIGVKVLA
ncbi:MAG: SpoIIE family protein phosphatase [Bacteroidales bacterium]|nr:SpoIIE family protein phosphatase [Bacteroidales bacterium]